MPYVRYRISTFFNFCQFLPNRVKGKEEHLFISHKSRKTHPSGCETGAEHRCRSQADLVTEDADEEGEEEGGADGEGAHQGALGRGVLHPVGHHLLLQLNKEDAKCVDDSKDDTIDQKAGTHHQPCL